MEWVSIVKSPSKSLFVVLLGFLLGIFVGGVIDLPISNWPTVIGVLVCLVVIIVSPSFLKGENLKRGARLVALVILFFLIGLWRFGQIFLPADAFLVSDTLNREVRIEGVVLDEVVEKNQKKWKDG